MFYDKKLHYTSPRLNDILFTQFSVKSLNTVIVNLRILNVP